MHYRHSGGLNATPIEAALGATDALKQAGGPAGLGVVLNLNLRRALPIAG